MLLKKKRKRFNDIRAAHSFAKKVGGQVNDLREIEEAKSNFTVTYHVQIKVKKVHNDWCPEENRDFGYPNEYWQ
jgi:hypothetical protein